MTMIESETRDTAASQPSRMTLAHYPVASVGERYEVAPDGFLDSWGWCASWCIIDGPDNGTPIDEHGPWCSSGLYGSVGGVDHGAEPWRVFGDIVRAYVHGRYVADDRFRTWERQREPMVRLILEAGGVENDPNSDCRELFLTPGEALRLAEMLTFLARSADDLHEMRRPKDRV